jgi:hypothetical protein
MCFFNWGAGIEGWLTLRVHLQDAPRKFEQGTPPKQAAMVFFDKIGSKVGLGEYYIRGCDWLMLIARYSHLLQSPPSAMSRATSNIAIIRLAT